MNIKLKDYIAKRYPHIRIVTIDEDAEIERTGRFSILSSLLVGLNEIGECDLLRLNFGDTLCRDIPDTFRDMLLISTDILSAARWTMVATENGFLKGIYGKDDAIDIDNRTALVGYFQFTDLKSLTALTKELVHARSNSLSRLLLEYNVLHPLYCYECETWFDFGHKAGLIKAQNYFYNSRDFNSMFTDPIRCTIVKSSSKTQKLKDEWDWYRQMPDELQPLVPRAFSFKNGVDAASLKMEMYGYPPLSELFILGNLDIEEWELILRRIFEVHSLLERYHGSLAKENFYDLYLTKTWQRFDELRLQAPCWVEIANYRTLFVNGKEYYNISYFKDRINNALESLVQNVRVTIVHGDYCLSNILFDVSSMLCKLIDPRGRLKEQTIYGDPRYDIAKLRHSVVGGYDFIVHGMFKLHREGNSFTTEQNGTSFQAELTHIFDNLTVEFGYDLREIKLIEALLFFSMIPLHKDDLSRQQMFYLLAVTKFNDYFGD